MATEALTGQSVSTGNDFNPVCPRCGGEIWLDYEEPRCINCGWRDYGYVPPKKLRPRGLLDVVRYAGIKPELLGKVVRVRWAAPRGQRHSNIHGGDMEATVSCPYCPLPMIRKQRLRSLGALAELHVCPEFHSLTLIHTETGALRWR